MSGALTSMLVLTDHNNVAQARHELHRATDFGCDKELAAWSRKWGEAAMSAADDAARNQDSDGSWCGDFTISRATEVALNTYAELHKALEGEPPNLEVVRSKAARIRRQLETISEALDEEP